MITKTLTIDDIAPILHAAPDTVRRRVRNGEIPMFRVGKEYIILADRFYEWLYSQNGGKITCLSSKRAERGISISTQTESEYAKALARPTKRRRSASTTS